VGTYSITLTVSDTVKSIISSFDVSVKNTPPRLTTTIPNYQLSVNSIGSYDLSAFFVDDDGNALTMTAKCSFAGGSPFILPSGILTLPNFLTVAIAPTQMTEMGIYLISVTVSDSLA
jgi:hypothetical protein